MAATTRRKISPSACGLARGRYGYQALLESPVQSGTSIVIYVIERDE
jgi:hypothetical protein